jgi:Flp pilus assembly protein TadG
MNRFTFTRIARFLSRLRVLSSQSGAALVETAIMLGLLGILLLYGTADLSVWAYSSIEVANAAHAGAVYGMQQSNSKNNTAIQTAAQAEASDLGSNLTTTTTLIYACAASQSGTTYATAALATANCTGTGNHAVEFIKVVASAPVNLPAHCCGIPNPVTVTSTSETQVVEPIS